MLVGCNHNIDAEKDDDGSSVEEDNIGLLLHEGVGSNNRLAWVRKSSLKEETLNNKT
jgi:hypothetical protein